LSLRLAQDAYKRCSLPYDVWCVATGGKEMITPAELLTDEEVLDLTTKLHVLAVAALGQIARLSGHELPTVLALFADKVQQDLAPASKGAHTVS
jgi:hypothetical protein